MVYTNSHLPAHLMTTYYLRSLIFRVVDRRKIRVHQHAMEVNEACNFQLQYLHVVFIRAYICQLF